MSDEHPVTCMHAAPPGLCAFAGCPHFVPDGPRDERWAFSPDSTPEDVAKALAHNADVHARAPGSASPIHMVVASVTRARLGAVGYVRCPMCNGTGCVPTVATGKDEGP